MTDHTLGSDLGLAREIILDELFDLLLYRKLRSISGAGLQKTLAELIEVEVRHVAFWQEFFKIELKTLNAARKLKSWLIVLICRCFGASATGLVLEATEIYGIRKYLKVWERYRDGPVGEAVRGVLEDEFKHEDMIVTRLRDRVINPDRVRNIFLGVNDGMVEILGAVSGFFASLGQNALVLIAGLTTAMAGAISMAAGAYFAISSEGEIRKTQNEKRRFLDGAKWIEDPGEPAVLSGVIVGISYFVGASFPMIPVVFGARTPLPSIVTGGSMILLISVLVAFLSGMEVRKRALTNLVLIALAAGGTYLIGLAVRTFLKIQI